MQPPPDGSVDGGGGDDDGVDDGAIDADVDFCFKRVVSVLNALSAM